MTTQMQELIDQLFEKTASTQLSVSHVFNEVYKVLAKSAEISGGIYKYFFPTESEAKKAIKAELFAKFLNAMPHVKYAGNDKIVVCDFVEQDPEKEYSNYFTECRVSVDDAVETFAVAVNVAQAEREVNKTEKVTLASGFVMDVPSKDAEGKQLKETKVVNVVPREKVQWGYTNVVKKALKNALISYEIENGLA